MRKTTNATYQPNGYVPGVKKSHMEVPKDGERPGNSFAVQRSMSKEERQSKLSKADRITSNHVNWREKEVSSVGGLPENSSKPVAM